MSTDSSPVRSVGPEELAPRRRGWARLVVDVPTLALLRAPGIVPLSTGGSTAGAYLTHAISNQQTWMGIAVTGIAVIGDSMRLWCRTYREVHAAATAAPQQNSEAA